tara:strand:+ start:216 stop:401 length:186 start_codon:yes stop_codon:yes gene_type:complete
MLKYVRIWRNNKKLDEWGKAIRKKLPNERLLEHFEADFSLLGLNLFIKALIFTSVIILLID